MANCDECGTWVSNKFYRFYSVNGELTACPECENLSALDKEITDGGI